MIVTKEILNDKVPEEMIPSKFENAMNLFINIDNHKEKGLLLYNTNPDTWNTLYPFYDQIHKFTGDYNGKKEITYKELIDNYKKEYHKVHEIENGNNKDKRKNILIKEFKDTFNIDVEIKDELEPIYELKYSKTKKVWTLYYFENFVVGSINDIERLLEQDKYQQEIMELHADIKDIKGVPVTENVLYILSNKDNVRVLEDNVIDIGGEE